MTTRSLDRQASYSLVPFEALTNRLDQMFHDFFGEPARGVATTPASTRTAPLDVWEDEAAYHLELEVPGVQMENIDIVLEGRELTVRGSGEEEREEKDLRYHRRERRATHFRRSLVLPDDVDSEQVQATLDDGILHVTLTKQESRKPRRIEIKPTAAQIETKPSPTG